MNFPDAVVESNSPLQTTKVTSSFVSEDRDLIVTSGQGWTIRRLKVPEKLHKCWLGIVPRFIEEKQIVKQSVFNLGSTLWNQLMDFTWR